MHAHSGTANAFPAIIPYSLKNAHFLLFFGDLFPRMQMTNPCLSNLYVSAKYSCGFPDPQVLPIIVESKDI